MFARFDKNKDGHVDKGELPAQMQAMMDRVDADKNGSIERAEWSSFEKKMRSGTGGPGAGGTGAGGPSAGRPGAGGPGAGGSGAGRSGKGGTKKPRSGS